LLRFLGHLILYPAVPAYARAPIYGAAGVRGQARRRQSLVAGAHGFMNCIFRRGRPGVLQVPGLDRPLFGAKGRVHQIANRRSPSAPNKIECRLRRAQGGQEFGALLRR